MADNNVDWNAVSTDAAATLSRYVQFDTTNPPGVELAAAQWLRDQILARQITEDVTIFETAPDRGLLLARIPGSEQLKPLLLNHHIDVVAADPTQWTYPPFSGKIADGYVWGRGTLDTKDLGIMSLLALELLRKEGVRFRRPIIYLAVPDEETGGSQGMRWLVERELANLDPEWVWDEGSGGFKDVFGPGTLFGVAVAEKQIQHLRLVAQGEPGHGSMPHDNNANVTLMHALNRVLDEPRPLRLNAITELMFKTIAQTRAGSDSLAEISDPQALRRFAEKMSSDKMLNAMLRDTISLTVLRAGYKVNVIPERAEAEIDCRLLPDTDRDEFIAWLKERIDDERITIEEIVGSPPSGIAPMDNLAYQAMARAVARHAAGAKTIPLQMPGGTDGRYFRQRGYPAYGFSPVILEQQDVDRVHGIDERISLDNLVLGVKIARDVIKELCVASTHEP